MSLRRAMAPTGILLTLVLLSLSSLAATPPTPQTPRPTQQSTPLPTQQSTPPTRSPARLTVHEWGTFTSVAGTDGRAVEWTHFNGADDLPCFVERDYYNIKGALSGTVRMETPVLYFYAPDEMRVNVNVRFRQGAITEWYPRAAVTPRRNQLLSNIDIARPTFMGTATWANVHVTPGSDAADFPSEPGASHYYLARKTDAAPVHVGPQQEKFLFYRGIGTFQPPVSARLDPDGTISVKSPTGDPLGDLILFENRDGKMVYQVRRIADDDVTLTPQNLTNSNTPPTAELEKILIAHGLFPREAKAMVDTWRDSWFEEGARLFYVASTRTIDTILPLEITPVPSQVTRAFVGRIELITPRTEQDVRHALDAKDYVALAKFERFLEPITNRVLAPLTKAERTQFYEVLAPVYRARAARNKCASQPTLETHTTQAR